MVRRMAQWAALTLAACITLSWACSQTTGQLSLADYFRNFDAIATHAQERKARIDDPFQSATDVPDGEFVKAARVYVHENGAALERSLAELHGLKPPDAAIADHGAFASALEDYLRLWQEMEKQTAAIQSSFEFKRTVNELLEGPAVADALQRSDDACLRLQATANRNGIEVDLKCRQ